MKSPCVGISLAFLTLFRLDRKNHGILVFAGQIMTWHLLEQHRCKMSYCVWEMNCLLCSIALSTHLSLLFLKQYSTVKESIIQDPKTGTIVRHYIWLMSNIWIKALFTSVIYTLTITYTFGVTWQKVKALLWLKYFDDTPLLICESFCSSTVGSLLSPFMTQMHRHFPPNIKYCSLW